MAGGVSANAMLRQKMRKECDLPVRYPPLNLCTDNAAMIGCAAVEHFHLGHTSPLTLGVQSRLAITKVAQLYQ